MVPVIGSGVGRASRRVLACGLLIVGTCACTGSPSREPSASPSAASTGSSSPAAPGLAETITLSCAQSGGGSPGNAGEALTVGALILDGFAVPIADVPLPGDVGLRAPAQLAAWHFRKVPVYLSASAEPVTLRMSGRGAAFAWLPAATWTAGDTPDLTRWASRSVTFTGCGDRMATYFGGLLADSPQTCLRFSVTDSSGRRSIARRLDGNPCS
jgi:hypothetical protein